MAGVLANGDAVQKSCLGAPRSHGLVFGEGLFVVVEVLAGLHDAFAYQPTQDAAPDVHGDALNVPVDGSVQLQELRVAVAIGAGPHALTEDGVNVRRTGMS